MLVRQLCCDIRPAELHTPQQIIDLLARDRRFVGVGVSQMWKPLSQFWKDAFERGPLARFAHDVTLRRIAGAERDARSGRRIGSEGIAIMVSIY